MGFTAPSEAESETWWFEVIVNPVQPLRWLPGSFLVEMCHTGSLMILPGLLLLWLCLHAVTVSSTTIGTRNQCQPHPPSQCDAKIGAA